MAIKTILAIFRAACYSPGMIDRDEAILRAVAERLEKRGYAVNLVHEEDFTANTPMPDIVLHMARSSRALDILQTWQGRGCRVINTAEGVRNVERATLAKLCAAQGIPTPKTWIIGTAHSNNLTAHTTEGNNEPVTFPCWIKRTGTCAQQADDVHRVNDAEEYRQCLSRFHKRGIAEVVIMEHIEGTCIKFYAVKGTNFIYSLPSTALGYDKFSSKPAEKVEEYTTWHTEEISFPFTSLDFQLDVYGGDLIIGHDGVARLIDLNDWPSFSACRSEAADAIAELVISRP